MQEPVCGEQRPYMRLPDTSCPVRRAVVPLLSWAQPGGSSSIIYRAMLEPKLAGRLLCMWRQQAVQFLLSTP